MKVRATQDGVYGGYVRYGAREDAAFVPDWTEDQLKQVAGKPFEGEVFEIDARPRPVMDENNKPVQVMEATGEVNPQTGQPIYRPGWELDAKGKVRLDKDQKPIPRVKMVTFFTPEWMVPVNEDATVTFPQKSQPFGILPQMRVQAPMAKVVPARPVDLPEDVAALLAGNNTAAAKELKQILDSPI